MANYYNVNPRFYVSVDCIIFGFDKGSLKLLLLKRNFEPAKGSWSLMGGFVQEEESIDDAAKRVLAELTGLEHVYMEQVGTFGDVKRDPGERVISVAYYALININEYDRALVQQHNAYWAEMTEIPPLIFDHPQMVERARTMLKRKPPPSRSASTSCPSCSPFRSCKAYTKPSMAGLWTNATSASASRT